MGGSPGIASSSSVTVVGPPRLLVDAVARMLSERGFPSNGGDDTSAFVMIEPDDATWLAAERAPAPRVVLAATAGRDDDIELIARGADAVITVNCPADALVEAVRAVCAGRSGLTLTQQRAVTTALRDARNGASATPVELTARERDILLAIHEGLSVKQVARRLEISPKTVENTRRVLYRKLVAKNRTQAVARAHELGLLPET
jgi:DNA-binding NarL/FixJ family response regulator